MKQLIATLINYTCKSFIELTLGLNVNHGFCLSVVKTFSLQFESIQSHNVGISSEPHGKGEEINSRMMLTVGELKSCFEQAGTRW